MDWLVETFELTSHGISLTMSIVMGIGCIAWISTIAFLMDKKQGIICLCTVGLYCIVFGFMQGKSLLIPTIGLLGSMLIGLISYTVGVFSTGPDFGVLIEQFDQIRTTYLV